MTTQVCQTCVMIISADSEGGAVMRAFCSPALVPGASVTYLGYEATVMHVFASTANIRFTGRSGGMSRQIDAPVMALVPVA
jgi:hypothetical protein